MTSLLGMAARHLCAPCFHMFTPVVLSAPSTTHPGSPRPAIPPHLPLLRRWPSYHSSGRPSWPFQRWIQSPHTYSRKPRSPFVTRTHHRAKHWHCLCWRRGKSLGRAQEFLKYIGLHLYVYTEPGSCPQAVAQVSCPSRIRHRHRLSCRCHGENSMELNMSGLPSPVLPADASQG